MLDWCREHASLLIVQSIPEIVPGPALRDAFPYGEFSVEQQGLKFVRCEEFLAPWLGKELLYWTRSHFHWTPFAHRLSGERLAEVIEQAWATDSPAGSSH